MRQCWITSDGEGQMAKVSYGLVGYGGIAHDRIAKEGFGLEIGRAHV